MSHVMLELRFASALFACIRELGELSPDTELGVMRMDQTIVQPHGEGVEPKVDSEHV